MKRHKDCPLRIEGVGIMPPEIAFCQAGRIRGLNETRYCDLAKYCEEAEEYNKKFVHQ